MKYILVLLLTLHSLVFAKAFDIIVTPSHEESVKKEQPADKPLTGKKLLIMISSGELEKASMGFTLGLSAAKKGVHTTIVIGAKALSLAKLEGIQNKFIAKDMTPRQILQEAIKEGASIQICGICAKAQALTEQNFIKGVQIVTSKNIFDTMYEEGTKVLSF
jgi:predicted peroxiredoxin